MNFMKKNWSGIILCLEIAIPSWFLGKIFPVIGGAVIAIIAGMVVTMFWNDKGKAEAGIKWTSKVILQTAVVLLGFGMNLGVIFQTGKQSLPIIICTITTSLIIAWIMQKVLKVPANTSILVGVGSSICGGSAIAATAPVIDADDDEIAQSIAVIFFFNVLALSLIRAKKSAKEGKQSASFSLKRSFPMFILYFVIAAIITTVCIHMGIHAEVFQPVKELSKFLIIMAMAAIGLNSNVIQLIKTGGKPIVVGASCWCGITIVSLMMQHIMKIW